MAHRFLTVPEELIAHAECVLAHYEQLGYTVKVEYKGIGFPYVPTLHCRQGPKTVLVEVVSSIPFKRLEEWSAYARSCPKDTRVTVAIPRDAARSTQDESRLRSDGIGLLLSDGATTEEAAPPHDLALNVKLPDIASFPKRLKKPLGPVYEQFNHSNWREGFDEACQVVTNLAKKYLREGIKSGRIVVLGDDGRPRNPTQRQINRMTLGQLAVVFERIRNPNLPDARIARVLKLVNPDRIKVAHYKRQAAAEAALRKNVPHHMWTVVDGLKALLDID